MNLFEMNKAQEPKKPYVMKRGSTPKYNKVSLDDHRVLKNGSIVVRTVSVKGFPADSDYDKESIKEYQRNLKSYKEFQNKLKGN